MAAFTDRLLLLIDANTGGAVTEMKKVGKEAEKLGGEAAKSQSKWDRLGNQFGVTGASMKAGVGVAAVAAGSALVKFGADGVAAASNLEQSVGAVESVFGEASGTIFKFGETAAAAAGLSKREVNEMAAVVGAQLQGMGFSAGQSAEEVIKLQKRAADMAATFGGTTKDALDAISATLRGERDPIEKYGVSLKAVDVNARIAALGLDTTTVAAEKEATAIASLDLIMGQTAKTHGQFGRESDTLAGQQARLGAAMENLKATVGEGLTPAIAELAGAANDAIGPLDALLGKLNDWGVIQDTIGALAASTNPFVAFSQGKRILDDFSLSSEKASKTTKDLGAATETTGDATMSMAEKLKLEEEAAKKADSALDKLRSATVSVFDATRSYESAQQSLQNAQVTVIGKQAALNELLRKGAVDAKAVASATKGLADANKALGTAQLNAAVAQERLNKAMKADPADIAAAVLDVREATLGVAEANDRLEDAQKDVNKAREEGDPEAIDDALRSLASAELAVERAVIAETAARKAQNDLNPNSEAGAQRVKEAFWDLAAANDAVAAAEAGVATAAEALAVAQAGDLDHTTKIAAAKLELVAAQNGVRDAQVDAAKKAANLNAAIATQAELVHGDADAVARLRGELAALQEQFPQFAGELGGMFGTGLGSGLMAGQISGSLGPGGIGRRAAGGPVARGGPTFVGEDGPELFVPTASGRIIPNHRLGGGGDTFNVYQQPGESAEALVARIMQYKRRNGSLPF